MNTNLFRVNFKLYFQFEGQGNLSKQLTQQLVYCSIFQELLNVGEYQYEQSIISFDLKQFSFLIKAQTQQGLDQFKQYLSTIMLIIYETKSTVETNQIRKLLSSEPLSEKLKKMFHSKITKIETLESINYSDLFTMSEIIGGLSLTSYFNDLQPNHLVFIFDNIQNIQIQYCINQFADFIQSNIKVGKQFLKIERKIYLEKADQLIKFQNSQKEVLIEIKENENEVIFEFTYWYFGNDDNEKNLILNQYCVNHIFEDLNYNIIKFLNKQFTNNQYCLMVLDKQSKSVKVFIFGPEKENQQARVSYILDNIRSNVLQIESKKFQQIQHDNFFKIRVEQRIQDAIQNPICQISYQKYENQFIYFEVIHAGEIVEIEEQLKNFIETESFSLIDSEQQDSSNIQSLDNLQPQEDQNSVATESLNFQDIDLTEEQFYDDWLTRNQQDFQLENFPQSPAQQQALFQMVNQQKKQLKKQIIQIKYQDKQQKLIIKEGSLAEEDSELFIVVVKKFQNLIDKNQICNQTMEIIKKFGINFEREMSRLQQIGQEVKKIMIKVNSKYILALENPYFYDEDGKANNQCLNEIKSNLNIIFSTASQNKIKNIAMPIFGCGPCDYSFEKASEFLLLQILINYRSQNFMQKLVVVEQSGKRVQYLINKVKNIEDNPFMYNWKLNGIVLNDLTNQLINKAANQNIKQQELEFSFFQQQSTHEIDMIKGEILELRTRTIYKLSEVKRENITLYYINFEPITERLNEFFIQLKYFNYQKTKIYMEKIFLIIDDDQMNYWIQIGEQKHKLEKEFKVDFELKAHQSEIIINQDIEINQEQNQEIIQTDL